MDKNSYKKIAHRQELAEINRMKALSSVVAHKVEANRITKSDSQYRPFEISFGSERLQELNDFISTLDQAEFDGLPQMSDYLLMLCQKFIDWKVEVGSIRLWHELFVRYDGGQYSENSEGSAYVIKKAWEQVKKEQNIIEDARQAYKERLNRILEDNPNMPSKDPAQWCSLVDGFSEFEALQEFEYPLSFNTVFGDYAPKKFYYGKLNSSRFLGEQ